MRIGYERDTSSGHHYEVVFCIFLLVLAFLYRDNGHLVYPQILFLLLLLLVLNLAAGLAFRQWPFSPWISAAVILSNCATITAILFYSGESESNLWVLYLLPIYTVCMLLSGREVLWVTAGAVLLNSVFCVFATDYWDAASIFNLSVKDAVFIFAAAVTWRVVKKDRKATTKLRIQRDEMSHMEVKIREQESHLQQAEKMADVGQMTSGIAHDLNNPLTVILGTVNILLEDDLLSPSLRPDLERINRSAQLCRTITTNVLGFARDQQFTLVPCDIQEIIESAFSLYESLLVQSKIEVRREYAQRLPKVPASVSHLQRVFLNLMSNARAAMKNGGVLTVTTKLNPPRYVNDVSWVQILVEDTGIGITEAVMQKIFKPFNTSKAANEGTGLGLYLSREIALKHNGMMNAENLPTGARFTLSLPVNKVNLVAA